MNIRGLQIHFQEFADYKTKESVKCNCECWCDHYDKVVYTLHDAESPLGCRLATAVASMFDREKI